MTPAQKRPEAPRGSTPPKVPMPLPDRDYLATIVHYDPETGKVIWRPRTPEMFEGRSWGRYKTAAAISNMWNAKWAGKEVCLKAGTGSPQICIFEKRYVLARVLFKIVHGLEPQCIDHINGNPRDNRICNLRAATYGINSKNLARSKANTSGVTGVHWHKINRTWDARIQVDGKVICLGSFDCFSEAVAARKSAEKKYDFHPNHGREA